MFTMTVVIDGCSVPHSKPMVKLGNGTLSVGLDVGVGGRGKGDGSCAPEVNLTLTRDEANAHSSAPRMGFTWPGTQKLHRSKTLGVSLR